MASTVNANDQNSKNVKRPLSDIELTPEEQRQALWIAATATERNKKLFRDFFRHFAFLGVYFAILFMQRDVDASYQLNQGIISSLITQPIDYNVQPFQKTWRDIGQWDELRDYYQHLLAPALSQNFSYADVPLSSDRKNNVQYVNQIIGSVRFRQLRVRNDSCDIAARYKSIVTTCYSPVYHPNTRDEEPFGPDGKYTFTKDAGGVNIFPYVQSTQYDTSGYVVDMQPGSDLVDKINQLVEDQWWDEGTRAIIVSFSVLNVNLNNRASVVYLLAEFTAAGLVVPNFYMKTFRTQLYVSSMDYFRLFLELSFCLFIAYYMYVFVRELWIDWRIYKSVLPYFKDFWNLVELTNLILFLVSIIMYLSYVADPTKTQINFADKRYISEMEVIGRNAVLTYQVAAFNILLSTFKTFKYLKVNKRLYVMWQTLYTARGDLLTFLTIFAIILLGFIFTGWLTFGADLFYFNGFMQALGTCWQFLIGNPPDYFELYSANRALGPLFFTLFTIFVFFILANMFIAIIGDSYGLVHEEARKTDNLSFTAISKPINSFVTGVRYFVRHKKRLLSESELLEKIDELPVTETELTNDEIRLVLAQNNLPVNRIYVSQVKSLLRKRHKIMKGMLEDKRKNALDKALEEELEADDILPLMRPDSFAAKGASTAIELVSLKRNGQRGRQTSAIIEKLDQLTSRIEQLEKEKNSTASATQDEDKQDESDKEDDKKQDEDKTVTPTVPKSESDDEKSE